MNSKTLSNFHKFGKSGQDCNDRLNGHCDLSGCGELRSYNLCVYASLRMR